MKIDAAPIAMNETWLYKPFAAFAPATDANGAPNTLTGTPNVRFWPAFTWKSKLLLSTLFAPHLPNAPADPVPLFTTITFKTVVLGESVMTDETVPNTDCEWLEIFAGVSAIG